jgi:hypothetical protein
LPRDSSGEHRAVASRHDDGSAGLMSLAVVWRVVAPAAVPLYDGLCLQHPYDMSPAPVTLTLPVTNGDIQTNQISIPNPLPSDGSSPQMELVVASSTLVIPSGARDVLITVSAVIPSPAPPAGHSIDGLVYKVTAATDSGQPVTVKAGSNYTLVLATTSPTITNGGIDSYSGGQWADRHAIPLNCTGSLAIQATTFGSFAVLVPSATGAPPPATASGGFPVWIIVVVLLVIFGVVVTMLRRQGHGEPRR